LTTAEIQDQLPLTETTFFILLALAPGPSHGYAIMKRVEQQSRERVKFSTGTLYGAIRRLLERGWIERAGESDKAENRRGRKTYRLTRMGRRLLEAETARLQSLVSAARETAAGVPA
jgi:DNA-binding PadR family transcriptional regulator